MNDHTYGHSAREMIYVPQVEVTFHFQRGDTAVPTVQSTTQEILAEVLASLSSTDQQPTVMQDVLSEPITTDARDFDSSSELQGSAPGPAVIPREAVIRVRETMQGADPQLSPIVVEIFVKWRRAFSLRASFSA